jgi:hypothetical protein
LKSEHAEWWLAALLAADAAGYSRWMGADEGTVAYLKSFKKRLSILKSLSMRGRIVRRTGAGVAIKVQADVRRHRRSAK